MVSRVAVLGAGSWGTTVASLLAPVVSTVLWARRTELADDLNAGRGNKRYLPGFDLPADLEATADLGEATSDAALVLAATDTADECGLALRDALTLEAAAVGGCDRVLTEALPHGTIVRGLLVEDPAERSAP